MLFYARLCYATQCYALLQTPTKYHCYFFQIEPLLNFQIFRASFDKRQSVIEYEIFMWKYEESLDGCFVYSPQVSPAPNAKLKFASVLNSQYKVFLISIYCWSDVLNWKVAGQTLLVGKFSPRWLEVSWRYRARGYLEIAASPRILTNRFAHSHFARDFQTCISLFLKRSICSN